MDADDTIFDGAGAAGRSGDLDRIPTKEAAVGAGAQPLGAGASLSVIELVDWMVRQPGRRAALATALEEPQSSQGKHLLPGVDRLLDICRIEAGQREAEADVLDLRAALRAVCRSVRQEDEGAAPGLVLEIDENVPQSVRVDRGLLGRTISILVSTATGDGDAIRVHVERVKEAPHAGSQALVLRFDVRPADRRVPAEAVEPLQGTRISRGPIPVEGISRLTLGICEELVSLMGGSLVAETHPDDGPAFRFTVPAATATAGDEDDA